jgi:hypothetical protein
MPVIPALRKLRKEDCEFKASMGYIARPCLKTQRGREKENEKNSQNGRKIFTINI